MAERWSRLAVATEAVLFAVPVTSLAVFALVARVSFTGEQPRQIYDKAEAIVVALPIVPLCAGWVLLGRFVVGGSPALRSTSRLTWLLAFSGAVLAIAALVLRYWRPGSYLEDATSLWRWVTIYFRNLDTGMLAVIPLIHLTIERSLRRKAPTSPANATAAAARANPRRPRCCFPIPPSCPSPDAQESRSAVILG